jgi:hypothetical protein
MEEASFSGRPAFTQVEDWVIHHPDITPTAFLLYMRLRSTTSAPQNARDQWKTRSRFTVDQMRKLLPGVKRQNKEGDLTGDGHAGARTVRDAVAVLVKIKAMVRTNPDKIQQAPVYAFPEQWPDGEEYAGPVSGFAVARCLRGDCGNTESHIPGSCGNYRTGGGDTPPPPGDTPPPPGDTPPPPGGKTAGQSAGPGALKKTLEKNTIPEEHSLTGGSGKDALPGDESETGGLRPSIEEISGAGAAVARQGLSGHVAGCSCPGCVKRRDSSSGVPQQPQQDQLDRYADEIGFSFKNW